MGRPAEELERAARRARDVVVLGARELDHRVRGVRVSRDQWGGDSDYVQACWRRYREHLERTWEAIEQETPLYADRVDMAVSLARGRVLELGCGVGNMTRWLVEQPDVESVVAVEAFRDAADVLEAQGLAGVRVVVSDVASLDLGDASFDTVLACELVEHLYADEEQRMLDAVRAHVAPGARYVVSVPLGRQLARFHVRGFGPRSFRRHLTRSWGPVLGWRAHGRDTQTGWGTFGPRR